jgi:hypothetical protein
LLSVQLACLAGLDPHTCGDELNYCLRARQLALLHKSDMTLLLADTEQFPPVVSDLWAKSDALGARLKAMPSLHRLLRLPGVTDMRQLINAPGTHVLSAQELALMTGKALPKAARAALLRFTAALCIESGAAPPTLGGVADSPAMNRKLLPQWQLGAQLPPYPTTMRHGPRQSLLEECFAMLTSMGGGPQAAPAPGGTGRGAGQPPEGRSNGR